MALFSFQCVYISIFLGSAFCTQDATIGIQLPRRSLLVKFTCDLCNERTSKLVNRLAYEKGLIYVQVISSCRLI